MYCSVSFQVKQLLLMLKMMRVLTHIGNVTSHYTKAMPGIKQHFCC